MKRCKLLILFAAVLMLFFSGCDGFFYDGNTIITLKGNTAEYKGINVNIVSSAVYGTIVEITGEGKFTIQGTLNQGFVAVSKKDIDVTIVLNGVNIFCRNYAALTCLKSSNVILELAKGTVNYLSDGGMDMVDGKYPLGYDYTDQPNATILTRRNLTIRGTGKLVVNSQGNNGIASRTNLRIENGDISVSAVNNGIKGNDSVTITGGKFKIESDKDGIISENKDNGMGGINISGGEFDITVISDAIQASTSLTIANAGFNIKTGGGSGSAVIDRSVKGLKAGSDIIINSGNFFIDSSEDGINSNGTIIINGGTFEISCGNDGIKAGKRLIIYDGNINIKKCYKGVASRDIDLYGGFLKIICNQDGINIAGGTDSEASLNRETSGTLMITGGEYYIESIGDGIDVNGSIVITGGTVVIFGSTSEPEVPIDYLGTFNMTGGTIIALGLQGDEAQQPSSGQYSFLARFSNNIPADSLINVSSDSGEEIITVKTRKPTLGIILCSPLLGQGTYIISSGGSHSGTLNNLNLMTGGTYSGGNVIKTITLVNMITVFN